MTLVKSENKEGWISWLEERTRKDGYLWLDERTRKVGYLWLDEITMIDLSG